mmetsp:Transcript_103035/g.143528  ORF Transcript_103035/g.143528 Transcript_103035/m.143528 type:complete len:420 (+) Transcript_103035:1170-2429(+)
MAQKHLVAGIVQDDLDGAGALCLKGCRVRAVLFGFLSHQANVGARTHSPWVESPILFAEIDALCEGPRVAAVRNACLEVLLLIVLVPHFAASANGSWHRIVDDDVAGYMEVCDTSVRIDHRHFPLLCVGGHKVRLDGRLLGLRKCRDLLVHVPQPVVCVDAQLLESLCILGKDILEVGLDAVSEHDRVGDFHHGGFQVQREQHILLPCIGDLPLKEFTQHGAVHEAGIQNLALLQGDLLLQDSDLARLGHHLDARLTCLRNAHRLLVRIEVAIRHRCHMRLGVVGPGSHGVRVLESILLHGHCCAAVGVSLAKHGVHRAAQDLGIASLDLLLRIVLGIFWIARNGKALALQLRDALLQLRHRGAHIRQLDDVGLATLRQAAQLRQEVASTLVLFQHVREQGEHASRHGNVLQLHVDAGL